LIKNSKPFWKKYRKTAGRFFDSHCICCADIAGHFSARGLQSEYSGRKCR